jgi:hypothetical protein
MTQPDNAETGSISKSLGDTGELKQKLVEMQTKMSALEGELNSLRKTKKKVEPKIWISRLILVIILFLAGTPPALVVADRWLSIFHPDWHRETWCKVDFLCRTIFPAYFLIIFGCFFALAIIMFFLRKETQLVLETQITFFENAPVNPTQMNISYYLIVFSQLGIAGLMIWSKISQQLPGWNLVVFWLIYLSGWTLRAIPISAFGRFWKRDGEYWTSLLLMHIAVIILLAAYYDVTQIFFLSILLLVFAFGNLWRFRKRVPAIFWLVTITLVFYAININAWWTSVIGDDYGNHGLAWNFAEKWDFAHIGDVLFKSDNIPYFSSFVQGISMKLLGHDSFGWRFSNLYLCALGVALFYFFCKTFMPQKSALVAASLLAFSHYVMTFGKIGYTHLQALFALSLVLAVAAWALTWRRSFIFALLGSILAMCFYLFPTSLYVIPVPLLLLLIYYPPFTRRAVFQWLVLLITWFALIYPLLMQPVYWSAKIPGTLFNRPDLLQSPSVIVQHFAQNLFYSFFSFLYIAESHFVAVSYIDPLTAVFFIIGFFVLVFRMRRQKFAVFTVLSFVFFLIAVGTSHDREAPPNTRMFLMLPWFALFGMWGIVWVEEYLSKLEIFESNSSYMRFVVPILLVAIAATNLTQAYKISYTRYSGNQSVETLFIGITQNIHDAEPNIPKNIAIILGANWGISGLVEFQNVYPHMAWFHLYEMRIKEPVLPETSLSLLSDRNTIIMITPFLDPAWQSSLDAPLRSLGKIHCDVLTPNGQKRFSLYHSPEIPNPCQTP